ncbi:myeloid-derived growth factor-like [Sphaerodactylus townsendi]|uniref:myeloid-derived growth factor-like n=1 Tax=Sphaerodactylus townsendi TaxID=933632 RepID=UPI0020276B16|nr:myeloid-derived growth factor-like [Sphaerodactylus townsendi]
MVAPISVSERRLRHVLLVLFFFLHVFFSAARGEEGGSTAEFDVRPGGMVHSFSKSLGDYACTFTYAAQGGTNEQWQMSVGVSEDNLLFSCSVWSASSSETVRMLRKSPDFSCSREAATPESASQVSVAAVSHKEGKFRSELSKLVIVAKTAHDEL